jgi:hypothetical protein
MKIIELAKQAGLHIATDGNWMPIISLEYAEKFAALVAAHEREACAMVCDDWPNGRDDVYLIGVAIRARGTT